MYLLFYSFDFFYTLEYFQGKNLGGNVHTTYASNYSLRTYPSDVTRVKHEDITVRIFTIFL